MFLLLFCERAIAITFQTSIVVNSGTIILNSVKLKNVFVERSKSIESINFSEFLLHLALEIRLWEWLNRDIKMKWQIIFSVLLNAIQLTMLMIIMNYKEFGFYQWNFNESQTIIQFCYHTLRRRKKLLFSNMDKDNNPVQKTRHYRVRIFAKLVRHNSMTE